MWAHRDMKIQIPQYLGLTLKIQIPQYLGLTQKLGMGNATASCPAPSLATARFLRRG